jgi:hypothetical protein
VRKSNAERQRDFRERRAAKRSAAIEETAKLKRSPEEEEWLQAIGDHLPGADASDKGDRPKGNSFVRTEITREWVLDQLRLFAIDPQRGTPAAVQALKVLLQEIPKGNSMGPAEAPVIIKNTVRVLKPSEGLIELRVKDKMREMGLPVAEDLPASMGRDIGDDDIKTESEHSKGDPSGETSGAGFPVEPNDSFDEAGGAPDAA